MFNVIRIWFVKVAQKNSWTSVDFWSSIGICWPTFRNISNASSRHNNLSADGRTMSCSMDYSTTVSTERIGNRRRKIYNLARWTQNCWSDERKNDIGQENGWWTADCRPKNPIFASKIIVRWSFLEMWLGFKWYIPTIISLQFERFSI